MSGRRSGRLAGLALSALWFGVTLALVALASYWATRRALLQLDPPAAVGQPHADVPGALTVSTP